MLIALIEPAKIKALGTTKSPLPDEHLELPELGALLPSAGHSASRAVALEPVRAEWVLPKNVAVSVAILYPSERSAALLSACLFLVKPLRTGFL